MTGAVSIEKRATGTSGRHVARIAGVEGEAELRFTVRGRSLIIADRTEAPASMRGTGTALALVEHMIGEARANDFEMVPVSPYVLARYRKHPSGATSWRAPLGCRSRRAPRSGGTLRSSVSTGKAGDH
jgi:predicted GNAT family acetyltransferase